MMLLGSRQELVMPIPTFSGPPALLDEATMQLRQPPAITATAQAAAGRLTGRRVTVRGKRAGNLAPVPVPPAPGWMPATAAQAQRNLGSAASGALTGLVRPATTSYARYGVTGREFSPVFGTVLGSDPNDPNYRRP